MTGSVPGPTDEKFSSLTPRPWRTLNIISYIVTLYLIFFSNVNCKGKTLKERQKSFIFVWRPKINKAFLDITFYILIVGSSSG